MCAVDPAWARATPSAKLAPTTGIPRCRRGQGADDEALASGVLPWLKITTASAPATLALSALTANVQVPRWSSAMSFGPLKSRPAKSAASHRW